MGDKACCSFNLQVIAKTLTKEVLDYWASSWIMGPKVSVGLLGQFLDYGAKSKC